MSVHSAVSYTTYRLQHNTHTRTWTWSSLSYCIAQFTWEGKSIQATPDPNLNFRVVKALQIAKPIDCFCNIYCLLGLWDKNWAGKQCPQVCHNPPRNSPIPFPPVPPSSLAHPTNPRGQLETPCCKRDLHILFLSSLTALPEMSQHPVPPPSLSLSLSLFLCLFLSFSAEPSLN